MRLALRNRGHSKHMFPPPPLIEVRLPAELSAPARARRLIGKLLADVSARKFVDDALLLTSEIVTNATAVGGGCQLSAWYLPANGALRVEVHDHSSIVPSLPERRSPTEITGRGLRIVDGIANRWGVDRDADGKSVWFELYGGQPMSRS